MGQLRRGRRYLTISIIVVASTLVGLLAPAIFNSERIDFDFETDGVVAAPRDQFDIGLPLLADRLTGTIISSGRLLQVLPTGRDVSGSEALQILKKGAARLSLERPDITIGQSVAGAPEPPAVFAKADASPIVSALTSMQFLDLTVRNGSVAIRLPGGFETRFDEVDLTVTQAERSSLSAVGTAQWQGQPVKLDIGTGRLNSEAGVLPISISMTGESLDVSLRGKLTRKGELQIEGDSVFSVKNLRALASSLRIAWPSVINSRAFSLAGPMNWTEAAVSFKRAAVTIDGNSGTGALTVKRNAGIPLLSGTLAFDELDLSPARPTDAAGASMPPRGWWDVVGGLWSTPLAKLLDADLRLSARQITVRDTTLGRAAATVSLQRGKLSAQLASVAFEGGTGSGQLNMDLTGLVPQTTIRGRLDGAPLGDLASTFFGTRVVEGRANVTVDLSTNGGGAQAMLESLSGQVKIGLDGKGAVGLDLASLANKPLEGLRNSELTGSSKLLTGAFQGTTQIDSLDLDMQIEAGAAECTNFIAKFSGHVAAMAGRINVASHLLDLHALIHEERAPKQIDPENPPLTLVKGRRLSVRGYWNSPSVKVNDVVGLPSDLQRALKMKRPAASK